MRNFAMQAGHGLMGWCPACITAPGRQESDHMTFVPIKASLAAW